MAVKTNTTPARDGGTVTSNLTMGRGETLEDALASATFDMAVRIEVSATTIAADIDAEGGRFQWEDITSANDTQTVVVLREVMKR